MNTYRLVTLQHQRVLVILVACLFLVYLVGRLLLGPGSAGATSVFSWTYKANLPVAREGLGLAADSTGPYPRIYAVGGSNGSPSSLVNEYNLFADTWVTKTNMLTATTGLGVVTAANGYIYAIGGWNGTSLSAVEEYFPLTDNWIPRANKNPALSYAGVAATSIGKIYAFGGSSGFPRLDTYGYDIATNHWNNTGAQMLAAREDLGAALAANGKIYAIGGSNSISALSSVEEYDPGTGIGGTWSPKASMPTARTNPAVVAAPNGKIYAIGGSSSITTVVPLSTVEEYDPDTDTWTTVANGLNTARSRAAAVVMNGNIYVVGGSTADNVYTDVVEMATISEPEPTPIVTPMSTPTLTPAPTLTPPPTPHWDAYLPVVLRSYMGGW